LGLLQSKLVVLLGLLQSKLVAFVQDALAQCGKDVGILDQELLRKLIRHRLEIDVYLPLASGDITSRDIDDGSAGGAAHDGGIAGWTRDGGNPGRGAPNNGNKGWAANDDEGGGSPLYDPAPGRVITGHSDRSGTYIINTASPVSTSETSQIELIP